MSGRSLPWTAARALESLRDFMTLEQWKEAVGSALTPQDFGKAKSALQNRHLVYRSSVGLWFRRKEGE